MSEHRAAVVDETGTVTNVVVLAGDHLEQPEELRYDPGPDLQLRAITDDEHVGPGYRWDGARWQPPDPDDAPSPAPAEPDPVAADVDGDAPVSRAEFEAMRADTDRILQLILGVAESA